MAAVKPDHHAKASRFKPPTTDKEMEEISKGFMPPNTEKWALNMYLDWRRERNGCDKDNTVPEDLLEKPQPDLINFWLSRFVTEVRNRKGEHYPPKTINQILAGLQKWMLERNPDAPRFLDHSTVRANKNCTYWISVWIQSLTRFTLDME